MFDYDAVENPDERGKSGGKRAGHPGKRGNLLEKTGEFAFRIDRIRVKSTLKDHGLWKPYCAHSAVDCGKPCGNGEKPCVSAPNLWKTLWILWKNVGKTVWNACVNPRGPFAQMCKKCEM